MTATAAALPAFAHRAGYQSVDGRDKWIVGAIGASSMRSFQRCWPRRRPDPCSTPAVASCHFARRLPPRADAVSEWMSSRTGWDSRDHRRARRAARSVASCRAPLSVIVCTEVLEHVPAADAAFANLRRLSMTGGRVVLTTPFLFPLHMEPFDYRRLTAHGIEQLAAAHGFAVERLDSLGTPAQTAATLLADLSIVPPPGAPFARARVALLRTLVRATVRSLTAGGRGFAINGHSYLGTAAVLRAA